MLRRSNNNRILGGVCAGFADWLGVDTYVVRLAFIGMAIIFGVGLGFYILSWIIIPGE